jgi:hypothetical protein
MSTQWHDPAKTPLPPVGTRILVYHPDIGSAAWQSGIEAGIVRAETPQMPGPLAETASALLPADEPGWRWAFAPELPEIPEEADR